MMRDGSGSTAMALVAGAATLMGANALDLAMSPAEAQECTVPRLVETPAEGDIELTDDEAAAVYDCLRPAMIEAYAAADVAGAADWSDYHAFSTRPYLSATHGGRQVMNYGNEASVEEYGKYEDGGEMPEGALLAKSSFQVSPDGKAAPGPLFLMQKMGADFDAPGHWQYALVTPNGAIMGVTNGEGGDKIGFCNGCHEGVAADQDYQFFLPEEYRVAAN